MKNPDSRPLATSLRRQQRNSVVPLSLSHSAGDYHTVVLGVHLPDSVRSSKQGVLLALLPLFLSS